MKLFCKDNIIWLKRKLLFKILKSLWEIKFLSNFKLNLFSYLTIFYYQK